MADADGSNVTGWELSVAATVTDNAVYTAIVSKETAPPPIIRPAIRCTMSRTGGTATSDERYSSGTKVTLRKIRPRPARVAYLTGWYADQALTQKITTVTMNSNKTVYAGWEATGVPDKAERR